MAKTLLQKFDEDFLREIKQSRSNPDAYERITQRYEEQYGFTPFESYDSFRKKKQRLRKK